MTISSTDVQDRNSWGGASSFLCVNEPGLYRLIFQSRKPEAETFKTWVFCEILPAIRETGMYSEDMGYEQKIRGYTTLIKRLKELEKAMTKEMPGHYGRSNIRAGDNLCAVWNSYQNVIEELLSVNDYPIIAYHGLQSHIARKLLPILEKLVVLPKELIGEELSGIFVILNEQLAKGREYLRKSEQKKLDKALMTAKTVGLLPTDGLFTQIWLERGGQLCLS